MFYVYAVLGFIVFIAGAILLPAPWNWAWIIVGILALFALPAMLSAVLDPLNTRRIKAYCASIGASDVTVEPFPNHYGVHFTKDNRKHYAKCVVSRGRLKWKGKSPEELETE